MKKLAQLFLMLFCFQLMVNAQEPDKKYAHDDSYYLTGAVPVVEGKVVFTKEFSIPGMSQKDIFQRAYSWMEEHLKKNNNNSRVVFSNEERGQIVGIGEEWIVFHSSALSLDRTEIKYQLTVQCQPEKCILDIEKLRFEYREGEEKYDAEEWIIDKYALNKSKTKLVRGLAKWRKKTVDFADELGNELATALSVNKLNVAETEQKRKTPAQKEGPIVIQQQNNVTVSQTTIPKISTAPSLSSNPEPYKEVNPQELSSDLIQMGSGKLVLVIGTDEFNMTMMTANAGGSLGKISGKPVVFSLLSPDQPYEAMEKAEKYTVRFYPANQNRPSIILECKKMPSQAPLEGQPRMYIGEIIKAKKL